MSLEEKINAAGSILKVHFFARSAQDVFGYRQQKTAACHTRDNSRLFCDYLMYAGGDTRSGDEKKDLKDLKQKGLTEASLFVQHDRCRRLKPRPGFEPGTYGLRNRCSTTEPSRRVS